MSVEFAVLAQAIDFINEDDSRLVPGSLAENVPDTARAHADEDFVEIAPVRAEKIRLRFTSNGLGQHGLARAGRANQQDALGQRAAEAFVLFRIAQKIDHL